MSKNEERPESQVSALKFDQGKPRYDLIPKEILDELGRVLAFGAQKYAAHNWRKGMNWGRLLAAACRHIYAYIDGQDLDPETKLSHLAHATACLAFLETYRRTGAGIDDRHLSPRYDEPHETKESPESNGDGGERSASARSAPSKCTCFQLGFGFEGWGSPIR